jgi:hypothetical protein
MPLSGFGSSIALMTRATQRVTSGSKPEGATVVIRPSVSMVNCTRT